MVKRGSTVLPDPDRIAEMARPVFERYGIEKAILFGSFATGRQTRRSDVDLILVKRTEKRFLDRYDGLLRDLYQAIRGRDIEVLIYTPEELARISERKFIQRALREGKVIYEAAAGGGKRDRSRGAGTADL